MRKLFMVVFLLTLHAHAQKTTSTPSHLKQHVLQVFALEDWALSCKWMLSAPYHDSVKTWEVLNTDSTVSFVSLLYPTEASYSKGSVYAGNYMILGDTLHPGALADTLGSFKRFYPMDSILDSKASIAFFSEHPLYGDRSMFLPDVLVSAGSFAIGDTLYLKDDRNNTAVVQVLEIAASNDFGGNCRIPFLRPILPFYRTAVGVTYLTLNGSPMGSNIAISKKPF
jgi:hypothetical protein